jgi:hypothetical protein
MAFDNGIKPGAQTPLCWRRTCRHWFGLQVFVGFGTEPGRTDGEKDEVLVAQAGDALAAAGWNQYHVARSDGLGGQAADLHPAGAGQNDIALRRPCKVVPPGGDAGPNAGPRDRYPGVRVGVRELVDMAAFGGEEFGFRVHGSYCFAHAGSRVERDQRSRRSGAFVGRAGCRIIPVAPLISR